MTIIKDIDLIEDIFKYDVVIICTSVYNALGNGFQQKMKINFPIIDEENNKMPYANYENLGKVKIVNHRGLSFCLCYVNKGRFRPDLGKDFLNYEALTKCLSFINDKFKGKRVCSTIPGLSIYEGDGDKEKIIKIVNETCTDIDITLYDYIQEDFQKWRWKEWHKLKTIAKTISKEEYYKLKNKYFWERDNGIWNEMPKDYKFVGKLGKINK